MSAFDTHKKVKYLQQSGFNEKQAEAMVETFYENREYDLSKLVTSEQLENTRLKLEASIDGTNLRLDNTRMQLEASIENTRLQLEVSMENTRLKLEASIESTNLRIDNLRMQLEASTKENGAKIHALEERLEEKNNTLKYEIKATIEAFQGTILKWMFAMFVTFAGLIISSIKLFM